MSTETSEDRISGLDILDDLQWRGLIAQSTDLDELRTAAVNGDNVFDVLMRAARVCSLQQVTEAFFEVGGQYRRNV